MTPPVLNVLNKRLPGLHNQAGRFGKQEYSLSPLWNQLTRSKYSAFLRQRPDEEQDVLPVMSADS